MLHKVRESLFSYREKREVFWSWCLIHKNQKYLSSYKERRDFKEIQSSQLSCLTANFKPPQNSNATFLIFSILTPWSSLNCLTRASSVLTTRVNPKEGEEIISVWNSTICGFLDSAPPLIMSLLIFKCIRPNYLGLKSYFYAYFLKWQYFEFFNLNE